MRMHPFADSSHFHPYSVLIFIITMLLLAADFYYLKNIAGRRLVGLRWWNEVNTATGESHWVFESQDRSGTDGGVTQNATDKRCVAGKMNWKLFACSRFQLCAVKWGGVWGNLQG